MASRKRCSILRSLFGSDPIATRRQRLPTTYLPRLESLEPRTMLASGLVVSELVADNHRNLQDFDDDWSDWIELLNTTTSPVNINGFYLTDDAGDLTKWQVPVDRLIGPGERLVIFSSGKDYVAPNGELHTSFRLARRGEYLALVEPDGVTIASQFDSPLPDGRFGFPQQFEDVSFGVALTAQTLYFDHPTPGEENVGGAPHVAAPPQFSVAGGTFTDDFVLELTTDIPGATIHLTTDKTVPTLSSDIYDPLAAIPITGSTQIRAIVAAADHLVSSVATQSYIKLGQDVRNFTSRLPLMILDNFGGPAFEESTTVENRTIGPVVSVYWAIFEPQDDGGQSSLLNAPELETRAGAKVRGASSSAWPKKAFTIEAWDEKDQDKNITPLDMPSESDWILSARYNHDRALMRNPFIFELSNQTGRYAVRTRFVEVFVNTDGGELDYSDYVGVYTFMEKIKRDADRVDVEKLSKNYDSEPLISGGYILKIDHHPDPGDSGFSAGGQKLLYVEPKEVEIKVPERRAQEQFIRGYIDDAALSLNDPNPETGFPSYIDVDSWIDFHLLNNLTKNPDNLIGSTFLFKTREGKLEYGPIWDFDRSQGSDDDQRALQPTGYGRFTTDWWEKLFSDRDFRQKYVDRYQELREGPWRTSNMDAIIFSMAAQITRDAADRNFDRWSEVRPNSCPRWASFRIPCSPPSWLGEVGHLRSWLEQRVNWIDDQLIPKPILTPTPQSQPPTPGGLPPGSVAFDFGPPGSAVADGYLGWGGDPFDPNLGYGWTSGPSNLVDRGRGGFLRADFAAIAPPSGTFSIQLDNGRYDVTIVAGDHDRDRDEMRFRLEPCTSNETGGLVTITQGHFLEKTYQVEVEDGRLDLEISDRGGVSGRAVINGLVVTPADSEEGIVPVGYTFTLSPPQGTKLFYTLNGPDPRISIIDGQTGGAPNTAGAISPLAIEYQGKTITITDATTVRARAFLPNSTRHISDSASLTIDWSGMIEQTFNVEKPQLVVTEIHNHPAPTSPDGTGPSLTRTTKQRAGNQPDRWTAQELTPTSAVFTQLGDLDRDGDVDVDDIDDLLLAMNDPEAYQARYGVSWLLAGDFNQDGAIDQVDIDELVNILFGT